MSKCASYIDSMSATKKWILGADPGKHGAIVLINAKKKFGEYTQEDVVCIPTKVRDGKVDAVAIVDALKPYAKNIVLIVQEYVHAIYGSSAKGSFEFGDANGTLRAALSIVSYMAGTHIPVQFVQPKKWQEVVWKPISIVGSPVIDKDTGNPVKLASGAIKIKVDTKATSSVAAHATFPGVSFVPKRCTKEHDGCVDAALIAYYGKCKLLRR